MSIFQISDLDICLLDILENSDLENLRKTNKYYNNIIKSAYIFRFGQLNSGFKYYIIDSELDILESKIIPIINRDFNFVSHKKMVNKNLDYFIINIPRLIYFIMGYLMDNFGTSYQNSEPALVMVRHKYLDLFYGLYFISDGILRFDGINIQKLIYPIKTNKFLQDIYKICGDSYWGEHQYFISRKIFELDNPIDKKIIDNLDLPSLKFDILKNYKS